ncbi:hypothetical protein M422DRAFT_44135 [Sphaerobolus stellatus SS14]|nr:hypothetical protein M422DRAFT_44135 [Sphaerobolus stellatus SS14]
MSDPRRAASSNLVQDDLQLAPLSSLISILTIVNESGVDTNVEDQLPGAQVKYGSDAATNRGGDNRVIPHDEGGDTMPSGRQTRASGFEGAGGPQDKDRVRMRDRPGDDDNRGNSRR